MFAPKERTIVLRHHLPLWLTWELPGCKVSSGRPDQGPQMGQLKPHTFVPHGLEAGHPGARCCQGLVPPEASRLGLEVPPSPCDLLQSSPVCVSLLTRTLVLWDQSPPY
ncbi:unnamed protein product [Rangifer tarandus platyrhynchus]|uniref:Uncharacterized protein n=2 Tax=Rangifer tarandus platyrhynchus TaxID=3082113 RepID=A0ACB0EUN0_RANTA|nr:unnamed protein product [Rangifer tarandus platyrhynchus]CAI9703983.1 unnamed protein product [Rangifer tarandus platyrhynchus]